MLNVLEWEGEKGSMNLIFLYGPPAVGKLTIGKALSEKIGLPLLDNHTLLNPIAKLFGWDHPERKRLGDSMRIELFAAAAKAGKSFITTFGGGGDSYDSFIQQVKKTVVENGGEVRFIHLTAPESVLFERVLQDSRTVHSKMTSVETLKKKLADYPDVTACALVGPHLEIDTSLCSVEEIVEKIRKELNLTQQ